MALVQNSKNQPPHLKLPNFEPLPPDRWLNRLINNLLKPLFYLVFTLILSIVIIPVYTIFENLNARSRGQRGEQQGGNSGYMMNGQPVERQQGSLQSFLKGYGSSYRADNAKARHSHLRPATS